MKNLFFIICLLPLAVFAQVQVIDTTQQFLVGKVERILPIGNISITAYVRGVDTSYTLSYISEGQTDRSVSATFRATTSDFDMLFNTWSSVLVNDKDITVNMLLGNTPIVVSNYRKNSSVKADIKIRESSFTISKDQLNKLFGKK